MKNKKSFKWIKWVVIGLVLALLAGGGGWYWWKSRDEKPVYYTAPITKGDLLQKITATGQLNPVMTVQVGSQISGIIRKILVDFNSQVKKGDIIAQIDPATYQANVTQAEGDLANAKANLELMRLNKVRVETLRAQDAAPQSSLDKATADFNQATATVKIKEGALEKIKVDLAYCTIYAPIDGIVISRNVDVGQTVAASLSAPTLFVLANDLAKMQIDANVAEADIGLVDVGQDVEFTVDAFPGRIFRGKVMQVRNAPINVQNVVTYDTVIEVSNDDLKLKPGMTAMVSILVARRDSVLQISNAALRVKLPASLEKKTKGSSSSDSAQANQPPPVKKGKKKLKTEDPSNKTIYVMASEAKDAEPQLVRIKVGITDGINTEILEGATEGQIVVIGATGIKAPSQQSQNPSSNNPFMGGGSRGRRG